MVVQKQKKTRKGIKIALMSALLVSALATASVFLGVSAAENAVSPTDESYAASVESADAEGTEDAQDNADVVEETQFLEPVVLDMETVDFVTNHFKQNAVYVDSFGDELLAVEKAAYDGFVKTYATNGLNEAFTVDISGFDYARNEDDKAKVLDAMVSASAAFLYDYPEAFWVRNFSYQLGSSGTTADDMKYVACIITPNGESYTSAYSDRTKVNSGITSAVTSIKNARESDSRYDTLKAIHDYICNNVEYDNGAVGNNASGTYGCAYTAAPLFGGGSRGKQFVCEGYSKSLKILCKQFNIPCALVSGTGNGGNHMWTYVQMDNGNWYAVDVTWDDGATVNYNYFLVGSNKMNSDHTPSGQIMVNDLTYPMVFPVLSETDFVPVFAIDSISLDKTEVTLNGGETYTLTPILVPEDYSGSVKWTSSDTNVATVSNGVVTAKNAGSATITVTAGGKSASCNVTVRRTVTLDKSSLTLSITRSKPNPTATLKVTTNGSIPSQSWTSSDTSVATVTQTGKVTAVGEGTANITCTIDGTTSEPCIVTVSSVIITAPADNTIGGAVYVLKDVPCRLTSAGAVSWTTSSSKIATVDSNGVVTGLAKGTATITAIAADQSKETLKITVVIPTESITPKPTAVSLYAGGSSTVKATLSKNSNDILTWTSNDESVATVSAKGVVKGVKQGETTITVKAFGGVSVDIPVYVRTKATAIAWTKTASAVLVNSDRDTDTFQVAITAPDNCNDSITWTSSSKTVASITPASDGKSATVKGLKKGTSTITAKTGSGKKVTWKLTVVNAPSESVTLTKAPASVYVGATAAFAAKVLPKTSNDIVLWSSSDSNVATVDVNGKVKGVKPGTVTITAQTFAGEKVAESTITVRSKATAVEWVSTTTALYLNTDSNTGNFQVAITAPDNCNDTITWTSSSKTVASVAPTNSAGTTATVTGLKKGTATITAKTGSGKKVTWKVTVVQTPAEDFTLKTTSAGIYVNGTTTLKATVTPKTSNEPVQWSSGDETIATVDQNGKVKGLKQGTVTITAKTKNVAKEVTVTVRTKATAINVDQTAVSVAAGESVTLNAPTVSPDGSNDTITWTSSSKTVATVTQQADGSAIVTGLKKGTATITVKTGSGKSKKIKVTVTAPIGGYPTTG